MAGERSIPSRSAIARHQLASRRPYTGVIDTPRQSHEIDGHRVVSVKEAGLSSAESEHRGRLDLPGTVGGFEEDVRTERLVSGVDLRRTEFLRERQPVEGAVAVRVEADKPAIGTYRERSRPTVSAGPAPDHRFDGDALAWSVGTHDSGLRYPKREEYHPTGQDGQRHERLVEEAAVGGGAENDRPECADHEHDRSKRAEPRSPDIRR